jgi:hypothetical protein
MFIDFLLTSLCLIARMDIKSYLTVFENVTITSKKRAGILSCAALICMLLYIKINIDRSILLLAFMGLLLSVFRLFWSWKILKEQIIDIIFLICFSMIIITILYGISYLPAIMTGVAILRIYRTGICKGRREKNTAAISAP